MHFSGRTLYSYLFVSVTVAAQRTIDGYGWLDKAFQRVTRQWSAPGFILSEYLEIMNEMR